MLDGKKVKNISLSWNEGCFFDFWSIVHFLVGMTIGFSCHFLGFGQAFSYIGTFIGMALYEALEEYFNIQETIENRILDVVYGMVGFSIAFSWLLPGMAQQDKILWFTVIAVVLVIGLFLGWRAYIKRKDIQQ